VLKVTGSKVEVKENIFQSKIVFYSKADHTRMHAFS